MTEQQKPPGEPGSPEASGKPGASPDEAQRLDVAREAEFPLDHELRAGDEAARREAEARRARMAGGSGAAPVGADGARWERDVLERVLMATLREQRAARRWRIFFRLVGLGILALILFAVFDFKGDGALSTSGRHTAMVSLDGEIAAGTPASAESINASLQAAFADTNAAGVILKINSPGGSPVQAGIINDEIHRLRTSIRASRSM